MEYIAISHTIVFQIIQLCSNTVVFHTKVKYIKQYSLCCIQSNTNKHIQLILRLRYLNIRTEIDNYNFTFREMFTWKIACVTYY